jgi:hypothetical protein
LADVLRTGNSVPSFFSLKVFPRLPIANRAAGFQRENRHAFVSGVTMGISPLGVYDS